MATDWIEDPVLGPDWSVRSIALGYDSEGPVDAALVRRSAGPRHSRAVLYLHGFVDYFFQEHQAQYFDDRGYDFYALDLRKYGRALHPGQTPNYITDLALYREEIDSAVDFIRVEEPHETVIMLGHSTGGLIASLWANGKSFGSANAAGAAPRVDGVILNSPWFDLNEPWYMRTVGTWLIRGLARVAPQMQVGSLGRFYGEALHKDTGGEWDYDLALKPHEGFPVRAAWLATIRAGHRKLNRGLQIDCPVLVLCSSASGDAKHPHPKLMSTDSVLNVAHMKKAAPGLGPDITLVEIPGGIHDLSLSPEPARSQYFAAMGAWLDKRF